MTYDIDSGVDEKPEAATLKEAKKAGEEYLKDGYEGFAVFNKKENRVEYIKGTFPFDTTFSDEVKRNSYEAISEYQHPQKKRRTRRTPKKTEDNASPVFSSSAGDQLSMFPSEQSEQDRANEYAMSQLISHGTSFEDGKFRIAEFFSQSHTREEKAKFLSDEFGWGGYAGGIESMDYRPGKGITMTRTDKEHPDNNISVHLTYPEVADMIDYLISTDRYIIPEDIENRQNRAIYYLKNYDPDNPFEAPQIEKAKEILDSYHIDYSQLLKNQPTVETITSEDVEELNAAIDEGADIPDMDALPEVPEPEESVSIGSAAQVFSSDGEREQTDITPEDIALLQTFEPRKSVLNFNAEELSLASVWGRRFASDIQEKSPFFRAENGEWRDRDLSLVQIVITSDRKATARVVSDDIKSQVIPRGKVVNNDSGWKIAVSRRGLEDTLTYARKFNDDAIFSLIYSIDDIIRHSVLLDTTTIEKNNKNKAYNSAFMHKFYVVCKVDNQPVLAKLSVEEFSDGKNSTLKRMYNLQDIKIEPLRLAAFTDKQLALSVLNGTEISVANLFEIVKTFDKDFYLT